MVDRSELTEPVILIEDRGYEAYNNMANIEQRGWKYLIRVKDKQGILSGLKLLDALEFEILPCADTLSCPKTLIHQARDIFQSDAL